jgi:hypothetical protein
VLAGELSAPEQSCRTVSNMIAKMSAEPESSLVTKGFSSKLFSLVESRQLFLKRWSYTVGCHSKQGRFTQERVTAS